MVAVGECGLDYFYEHSPRAAQRAAFAAQIALAHAHDLALVIHARDAWADLFDVLAPKGVPERTVLHCFTGGPDEVERCLAAGMFVSFSGIVTFKNAADVRAAAARCPLDRLLVETDSPFLAPVPHRGRPTSRRTCPFVGEAVAAVKGCTVDEVMERSAAAAAMVVFHRQLIHRCSAKYENLVTWVFGIDLGQKLPSELGVHINVAAAVSVTWGNNTRKRFFEFRFARSVIGSLSSPETPRHP